MATSKHRNRVLFCYNPNSGDGLFKSNLDYIIERFQMKGLCLVPVRMNKKGIVDKMMAKMNQEEYRQIVAAGGDGTLHICVNAMIKNKIHLPLAIFPSGTSNDFAHYLELPREIKGMISIALGSKMATSDVGMVNGRAFINVAAVGTMVDLSQRTDSAFKSTMGPLAYYIKGVSELHTLKASAVRVKSREIEFEGEMYFMLAMNGTSAGGFRRLSPDAEINDGKLSVTIFKKMPVIDLMPLVISYLQGQHQKNRNVIHFQTEEMWVDSKENIGTDLDGEEGEKLPLHFTILKKRLLIFVPKEETAKNEKKADRKKPSQKGLKLEDFFLQTTEDYEKFIPFFIENDLEFSEEEPVSTDLVKGWELLRKKDEKLAGAVFLAMRQGEYIIDGIAVDPEFRNINAGKILLEAAIEEVKKRGGTNVYLVARAPGFFRKMGFETYYEEDAPFFFECLSCPQYNVSCFPEVMKLEV